MNKNNFKVVNCKGDLIVAILCAISMTAIGGFLIYHSYDRAMYAYGIMSIITGMGYLYSEFLFCIKVSGTSFNVRTYFGNKYQFQCSDIDKILCEEISSAKRGIKQILTISVNGKKVRLRYEMDGISELASYFLEQRQIGTIKKGAISQSTVRKLKQYIEWKTFEKERKEKKRNKRINEAINVLDNDTNIVTLMNYTQEGEVNSLLERFGGYGQTNCYFTAHNDESIESLSTKVKVDDLHDGYLINKTKKGLAMIPLEHLKSNSVVPGKVAVLEEQYYFIKNENIKEIKVSTNVYKGELCSVEIVIELDDRNIYLISTPEIEELPYHYNNLIKFVDTYTK